MSRFACVSSRPLRAHTRLTLWYTAILAGSMLVLGSIALWVIDRELWLNLDEMLRSRAGAIESDLLYDTDHFGSDDAQEADALGANLDIVREWNRNGTLLYSRVGASRDLTAGAMLPSGLATDGEAFAQEHLPDGRSVRLFNRIVSDGEQTLGYIQVGRATDEIDRIIGLLQLLGAAGFLLTLAIAGAGGWFLAGRALGPIARITRAAERIGADDLSRRLDLRLPDDELGRLARSFDAMIARLEDAFERQRRFTADASHELRTPLGVIRAQSELALSQPRSPEYYTRILGSIHDEAGRLTRLAEDLLVLARADAGETLDRQEVDFQDLVAEVGASVAPRARTAQIHFSVQLDECAPIQGDETWLKQLLLNLLDNAIHHTPLGGRVTLSLRAAPGGAVVQITDTGAGIAPEHLPRIFERFYRADEARSRATGGAGLGLAICRWIASAHGGTLVIESEPGVGTSVRVWLPTAEADPIDRAPEPPEATGRPIAPLATSPRSG